MTFVIQQYFKSKAYILYKPPSKCQMGEIKRSNVVNSDFM